MVYFETSTVCEGKKHSDKGVIMVLASTSIAEYIKFFDLWRHRSLDFVNNEILYIIWVFLCKAFTIRIETCFWKYREDKK